uniref:Putative F-box protein n=1 Tax=Noccaea caerulescens TaxID=107243 RepID=A0A1J3JV07_NOCCA
MASTGLSKKKEKVRDELEGSSKRRRGTMVELDSNFCGFDKIPEDILMKILLSLPAKSVVRSMCVSQVWYSLIATSEFTKKFMESPSSSKRPRIMASRVDKEDPRNYAFLTSTQDNHSDSSEYVFDDILKMPKMGGYLVNALRGLICLRLGTSMRICNLTTRQRVFLPDLTSSLLESKDKDDEIWSYFGYDPIYDEYKVLSFVSELSKEEDRVVRSEHQVLVLGPGASWRHIESSIPPPPHRPYSRPISIDNMLYYGAWVDKDKSVVMSFDLANEDFLLIEPPVEAGISWGTFRYNLVNYQGKLSACRYSRVGDDASLNLWIMGDARKKTWSNMTLLFPLPLIDYFSDIEEPVVMVGTDHRGEVRLSKLLEMPIEPAFCVIHDLEKMKTTKSFKFFPLFRVLGGKKGLGLDTVIWKDDIDNIMYLET